MAAWTTSVDEGGRREAGRARRRGTGHEIDVARPQRVDHQSAQSRPGGHDFDDERAAEEGADHHAVETEDGPAATRARRGGPARRAERRRARSVARRKGSCETSASDCDCSRSRVAASGRASASAGTGRCAITSTSQRHPTRPPTEVMPPTGSHPVLDGQQHQHQRADQRRRGEQQHRQHARQRGSDPTLVRGGVDAEGQADQAWPGPARRSRGWRCSRPARAAGRTRGANSRWTRRSPAARRGPATTT